MLRNQFYALLLKDNNPKCALQVITVVSVIIKKNTLWLLTGTLLADVSV